MSIDAIVKTVIINEDGSGRLDLINRPARKGEYDGCRGQPTLKFESGPEEVTALNWLPVWGGSSDLMLGEKRIAYREGYTGIRFVDRQMFVDAIVAYNAAKS